MAYKIVLAPRDNPQKTDALIYPLKPGVEFATIDKAGDLIAALNGANGYVVGLLDTRSGFVLTTRSQVIRAMWQLYAERPESSGWKFDFTMNKESRFTRGDLSATKNGVRVIWDEAASEYRVVVFDFKSLTQSDVDALIDTLQQVSIVKSGMIEFGKRVGQIAAQFEEVK